MYYQVTAGSFSAVAFLIEFQMDLYKAIQELYAEKEKLERVIASLEELQRSAGTAPVLPKSTCRRGRKSMNSKERLEVSEHGLKLVLLETAFTDSSEHLGLRQQRIVRPPEDSVCPN